MGFLLAHIVLNTAFSLCAQIARDRRFDYYLVTGLNYLTGLTGALIWLVLQPERSVDGVTIALGAVQGAQFAITVGAIYYLLARSGVGVTFVLIRLSVVIPTLVSLLGFNEILDVAAAMGLIAMLAAIVILGLGPVGRAGGGVTWDTALLLFVAIGVTGIGWTASKLFTEWRPESFRGTYVVSVFAAASLVAAFTFLGRRRLQPASELAGLEAAGRPRLGPMMLTGLLMGTANVAQNIFLIAALAVVPGSIAFPMTTALSVVLTTLAGMVVWGERHGPLTSVGIGLAVAGLVLVNV